MARAKLKRGDMVRAVYSVPMAHVQRGHCYLVWATSSNSVQQCVQLCKLNGAQMPVVNIDATYLRVVRRALKRGDRVCVVSRFDKVNVGDVYSVAHATWCNSIPYVMLSPSMTSCRKLGYIPSRCLRRTASSLRSIIRRKNPSKQPQNKHNKNTKDEHDYEQPPWAARVR